MLILQKEDLLQILGWLVAACTIYLLRTGKTAGPHDKVKRMETGCGRSVSVALKALFGALNYYSILIFLILFANCSACFFLHIKQIDSKKEEK